MLILLLCISHKPFERHSGSCWWGHNIFSSTCHQFWRTILTVIQWPLSYGHLHHSWGITRYWRGGALRRGVLSLCLSFLFALICFTSRGEICDVAAVHQSREGWGQLWERGHCGGHPEELGGVVVHQVSQCRCVNINVPVKHCSRLVLWSRHKHCPDLPWEQTPQKLFHLGTLMCFSQGFVDVCTYFIAKLVLILQKIGHNYSYKYPQKVSKSCWCLYFGRWPRM